MESLLNPAAVAVVGASERKAMAARLTRFLLDDGFTGAVYPVNPRYEQVHGLPCYPALDRIPGPVDLVLIMVPADRVAEVVAESARAGARLAIVLSSGFAEVGPDGAALQDELAATARRCGIRVLGPNCQGLLYRPAALTATFSSGAGLPSAPPAETGGIAYVGQSGALGGSVLGMAADRGVGLTAWISVGNQADLTATEATALLLEDPAIRVLACYLEQLPDGAEWTELADRAAELGKHLVVLRSGRSETGRRAVASHTGALVRSGAAFDLVAERSGAVLVDDIDELLDTAIALGGPRPAGGRLGVVTSSGGAGGLAADQAEPTGLRLPELDRSTQDVLAPLIPPFGSLVNPVDVTAQVINDASALGQVCEAVAADDAVDAVLVLLTTLGGRTAEQIAESILRASRGCAKPYAVAWQYSHAEIAAPAGRLRREGIPVVSTSSAAITLLSRLLPRDCPTVAPAAPPGSAGHLPTGTLTEAAGARLLDALGVARPRGGLATGAAQAEAVARELHGELVLKVQSPDVPHKTEVGGVLLGVPAAEAGAAAERLLRAVRSAAPHARIDGVLVQELAAPGVELLVGVRGSRDGYPPVLTAGFGGVTAELYADVVTALAPVDVAGAERMLRALRGAPLLTGFRGRPPADVRAAATAIAALSQAAAALGDGLAEFEINPLIVHAEGATAADLLLTRTSEVRG
ncbi:acetate--CoA ligase family protein [Saccharopolyspora sp. NFXS83]|uniref:acetate--CoA ligase family protein n=1 Tax=Saccharopolyspora sp. NFXS83 TaxID=2993560 RepID=UPI00224AC8A2|nr:acetate--CoA ligase [Saccharopolyspora sp. NFXS83]MCX2730337.1 acetate--CoA ligase family protein [Saccharopolyspora sp. NFXS83]